MDGSAERVPREENAAQKPEVQESAEIHFINDYAKYSALPGEKLLKREEFDRVTQAAMDPDTKVNEIFAVNAGQYADREGITLSKEDLKLYSVLRGDDDISSPKLRSDQPRLAEVLRMQGRPDDAEKLIAAFPNVTF
jgi:hypothetical protein